jgi:hypothetical protein
MTKDRVYHQRANGREEYWTYSEGRTMYLPPSWVSINHKTIDLVEVQ